MGGEGGGVLASASMCVCVCVYDRCHCTTASFCVKHGTGQPVPALTLERQAPGKGSHRGTSFEVTCMIPPGNRSMGNARIEPRFDDLEVDAVPPGQRAVQATQSCLFVGCLTSQQHACVSQGTDLHRQLCVLPH